MTASMTFEIFQLNLSRSSFIYSVLTVGDIAIASINFALVFSFMYHLLTDRG